MPCRQAELNCSTLRPGYNPIIGWPITLTLAGEKSDWIKLPDYALSLYSIVVYCLYSHG